METIIYDKLPENYDVSELAERADIASTYLGNKIRNIIANGVPRCFRFCTTTPPIVSLQPDHSWFVSGGLYVGQDDDIRFNYTAVLLSSRPDYIRISRMGSHQAPKNVPLDSASIQAVIQEWTK